MTRILLLFFINYFLVLQISHAQHNHRDWPNVPPSLAAKAPHPTPTAPAPIAEKASPPVPANAPTFDTIVPKCYPETATAYFLPAPPSSPKITVLNPSLKDFSSCLNQNEQEKPLNLFKEVPATITYPHPSEIPSRVALSPPPPCLTGLPDLLDEIPFKTQERIIRLADTKEKAPVCESCAALLKKLPIFNFDQELLDGFLAGIGL